MFSVVKTFYFILFILFFPPTDLYYWPSAVLIFTLVLGQRKYKMINKTVQ